ncbi:MAG TPA: choice-of-anchor D domain-containing protein, partial [Steroidobacteraceae bacterium]|nr:choice-of-anchor D domain-containing protein [Steroidobacteraceae bacterium]
VMSLDGTGTAAPPPSYASYSLGTQPIVQANGLVPAVALAADVGGTATAQLVLTNTGGEPFTISGVSLPTSAAPWSITSVNCLGLGAPSASSPMTLAPGQICTIGLQFAPTALGIADAALTVLDTAGGSNLSAPSGNGQEFLLQGTGGQPNAQYSPVNGSPGIPEINFGNVPENSASTQQVTVTNTGNGPLTITGANIVVSPRAASTLAYWTLSRDCNTQGGVALFPVTLVTGESCVFTFQLDPSTAGNLVALVSFFDNAAQSNLASTLNGSYIQQVKLYGVGVVPLSGQLLSATYTPEELNFTNPSGLQNQTVTVTNTGTQPLVITGAETPINTVSTTGGPGAFTLLRQGCTGASGTLLPFPVTLASDAACTFTFQYNEAVEQQIVGPLGTPASFVGVYATFYTNAYETNIGSSFGNAGPVQYVALLTPNEATAKSSCGSSAGLGVSASPVEQGVLNVPGVPGQTVGSYGQTVTVTDSNSTTVGFDWVVLEGLNTSVEEVSGTTPTDTGSVYACGDVAGSPAVLVQMQRGSGTEPLIYPDGIFPSYQYLKLANGSGSP